MSLVSMGLNTCVWLGWGVGASAVQCHQGVHGVFSLTPGTIDQHLEAQDIPARVYKEQR